MTHHEDANQSTIESYPLRLELTDTSYINATLLDTSVVGEINSPERNNQPTTSTVPAIPIPLGVSSLDDNNATKKKRKKQKENIKNGNTLSTTTDSSSAAGSGRRSILGYANSPSPLQAKISDDLSTCSYLINLDSSSEAYLLEAGNDNTEDQGESLCAENLSCSMLSCQEVLEISEDIKGLNCELLKRDECIEKLAKSLEDALKAKEEQEKEVVRLANNIEIVQHELNKFTVHTSSQIEDIRGRSLQQFEISSYLNPPNERSLVNTPLVPETNVQFCQTDGTNYKSVGTICNSPSIEPAVVQQNCHNLQLSSEKLRSELVALKLFVSEYFESMKRINSEDIVRSVTNLYHKQNENLESIRVQYSEDSSIHNNVKLQLEQEIEDLKNMHHKSLEIKNEEIQSLIKDRVKTKEAVEEYKRQQENHVQTIKLANEGALKNKNNEIQSLNAEVSRTKEQLEEYKRQQEKHVQTLQLASEGVIKNKNNEIQDLNAEMSRTKTQLEEYKQQQENDVQTMQLVNEGVLKNKNNEVQALNAKVSRLEETIRNSKSNEKNEIDRIKQKYEDILRSRNEEIRCLHVKVSKMEERSDQKSNSMVSRLSPEGSELETEQTLNDASSSGIGNHFHLTRTKMDYLKLTPPVECIDDGEILEQSSSSDVPNSIIEDLKLQLLDLEKKFEANRKYLDEQTFEREQERDEFHKAIESLQLKIEDSKKDKDRLNNIIANQKLEIGDYETRLRDAVEMEQDLIRKGEHGEDELKSAVDKIFELREIIRDLEEQIDTATVNALELKDQNQLLSEELDRLETVKRDQEDALQTTQDTIYTLGGDMVEELQTQIQDLTRRLEKKLNEMDNFPWQTRPNSSCSGAISVSTEDVSVREFSYLNRDKECDPKEAGSLLCDGLRRLDTHFENLLRFEEVIVKKLQDAEMRLSHAKQRHEEMDNERLVYQENIKSQINKIADLESRLDQFRFEPSPSVVTLSGLRARVTSLTEECEQYKGNLELRTIELQDTNNRLVATQAMIDKYKSMAARNTASPLVQNSMQTEKKVSLNESYSQTEKIVDKLSTSDASVQTNEIITKNKGDEYMYFNRPSFEISTIPGGPAPTYSTPNEILHIQKSSIKTKTPLGQSWTLLGAGDSDLNQTPETGRNRIYPSVLAFSSEKSVDRFSNNKSVSFNIKELEQSDPDGREEEYLQDVEYASESPKVVKQGRNLAGNEKRGSGEGKAATERPIEGMAASERSGQDPSKSGSGSADRRRTSNEPKYQSGETSDRRKSNELSITGKHPKNQRGQITEGRKSNEDPSSQPKNQSGDSTERRNSSESRSNEPKTQSGEFGDRRKSNEYRSNEPKNQSGDNTERRKSNEPHSNESGELAEGRKFNEYHSNDPENQSEEFGDRSNDPENQSEEFGDRSNEPENQSEEFRGRRKSNEYRSNEPENQSEGFGGRRKSNEYRSNESGEFTERRKSNEPPRENDFFNDDGDSPLSTYEDDIHGGSSTEETERPSVKESEDYFAEVTEPAKSSSSVKTVPDNAKNEMKEEQIAKLLARIKELEDLLERSVEPDDKFMMETQIEFDKDGVTPMTGMSGVRDKLGDTYFCNVPEFRNLIEKIEKNKPPGLTLEETDQLIRALKDKVAICLECSAPVKKVGEDSDTETYSYDVKAVSEYTVDEEGKRHHLKTEFLCGEGRIQDTDKQIAIETMKTQMDQLNQALCIERSKCLQLAQMLSETTGQSVETLIAGLRVENCGDLNAVQPSASTQPQPIQRLNEFVKERDSSNECLQQRVESLTRQLEEKIQNEFNLSNKLGNSVSYLRQKQMEEDQLMGAIRNKDSEIQRLKTQLEVAAAQIRGRSDVSASSTARQSVNGINYLDLYLKARSFRKALIWQKKYLMLVIQGYKDILRASGLAYDPDLLQKTIPIAPSSVGLVDRKKKSGRFRIVARAVMALCRMKYMVSRWKSKSSKTVVARSSGEVSPAAVTSIQPSHTVSENAILSPPTKDPSKHKSTVGTSITTIPLVRNSSGSSRRKRSSLIPRYPSAAAAPIEFSNAPSTSSVPPRSNVLSQYLDRFEYLETQLGSSLGREINRPPDEEDEEE